ncbi:sodium channel protein type 4 subunit alpha B-like isoform X1 [Sebastes umbrosus]|uniref:sodium channel protein type 4 subunit alpha B-like isoform X1 n=1 Tax=Sebastes umbrosus TaxID=72105 RepID=UPI00189DA9EB|nr:sodium channel protein type 4 subunit alpha B-like isoform X1 [Sebastes umbrosus]
MTSRKMSFFELWRNKKERADLLRRANQLKLHPAQLRGLFGDSAVRVALQNTRVASLLPPVGTDVFRRLTPASLGDKQRQNEAEEEERQTRKENRQEVENDLPKPASDLEAGKPLPFFYGDPPAELLSSPLEELDPFYQSQKTFIVLGKGNIIHRFNAEPACYLLSPFNPLRTIAINILIHSLFRVFILLTILTNCAFMMMSDPPAWSKSVELVFTAIYTFEAIIKVVSKGFCVGKFTFLRDPWNWLDIMVIITGYLTEFVDFGKLSVLRTVPRVMKIITVIPGLKTTVGDLVQSVKGLAGVIVLMVFCLSYFALIGLQLFMGSLKRKCVIGFPTELHYNETEWDYNATQFHYNEYITNPENYYFMPGQIEALLCGNSSDSGICPEGFICLKAGKNPNYGFTSYDSFGWSLLSMVTLMSQDFCENLVQLTLRAAGKAYLTFFVVIVFPGCFCLLSLAVAAVAMASGEREEAGVAELKEKEEEFGQIMEALKRREEEEQEASRAAPSTESMRGLDEDRKLCSRCWLAFAGFLLKWNCCGCWRWLKQQLYAFITNPFFDFWVVVCLILYTLFMAMEHYPMTPQFESMLVHTELAFTAIFAAEMVVKLVAMDPYGYFQVGWNIFDSVLVVLSLLCLFLDVSGLRFLILMRMLRLARWWPALHVLLKVIWTSVRALRNLTLVLLIMVFIFTVVGMQLFQQDYKDHVCRISMNCQLPRWHMCDFFHVFLIIIRVLCGEWIETMWDCMEVSGQTTCLIFFMMVLVIGNLLVLNLFLALLLSSDSSVSLVAPEEKETNNFQIAMSRINRAVCALLGKKTHMNPDPPEVDGQEVNRKQYLALTLVTTNQPMSEVKAPADAAKTPENKEEKEKKKHPDVQQHQEDKHQRGDTPDDCCSDKCYRCCPFLDIDTSQGGGRVWFNFRRACFSIVQHKCFETFIIVIILLSSVALVFEDVHLQQRQVLKMVLERADQVFTFVFLMEMLLKWIAFGLKKYFSSAWCWLDFLILHVSLVSLAADWFGFSELGVVRTLRALGPLRALSRFPGLRVVVQVLVRSVSSMVNVLLVFLFVWLVFSVMGVNLFAGKFYYCFNDTSEVLFSSEDVENKSMCHSLMYLENASEVHWKNSISNYDDVLSGYLSLLHVATSNWMDIMYAAVDSTRVESQPVYDSNISMYLYFISFLIISSFFTFNLFIRVIIDNLQGDKFAGKPILMTEEQQKYCKALKERVMKPQKPVPRPQNRFQARLFDMVTKRSFLVFILVLICLYMVTRMMETDDQRMEMEFILAWFHFVFIILFFIEFIVKIIALRQHYFTNGWNILDFVVIIVAILGMFFADLMEKYLVSPSLFLMLRGLRIGCIFFWFRGIRKLLLAFIMSLPALFNISLLLFIIMFIYSIFGMFHFAHVKREPLIDDIFNFETFGNSMICMFMATASTGWGGLQYPMMDTPPDCDPDFENCGNPAAAIAFFVTYIILSFLLVLHLFIAVFLETLRSEDAEPLSDDDLQMFYETWRKFDPKASQFIQYSELSDFCLALKDPLRIPKPNTIKLINMDPPLLPGDKVHYTDVLLALSTQVLGDSGKMNSLKARMEEMFTTKVSCEPISSSLQRKPEEVAVTVIQRAYRRYVLKHGDGEETAVQSVDGDGQ